jgi:exonuclease SbcC
MIPVKLQLSNFMSYADAVPPLSFENIHLACLSGDNGNGKSALLDAMTWAIWGKARSNHDDELMRVGAQQMQVEFDFDLGGDHYRVMRRRTRRGRTGQSVLEFQLMDGNIARPLTGNSIQETQKRIIDVLKLDYDTFVNSAYLRQGHADEFTLRTPAERKQVLATILDLAIYDTLCDKARRMAQQSEADRRALEGQIQMRDAEIAHRNEYEERMKVVSSNLQVLNAERETIETRQGRLQGERQELEAQAKELERGLEQQQRYEHSLQQLKLTIESHKTKILEYERLLAQKNQISDGYLAWQNARLADTQANQCLTQLRPLEQERHSLLQKIEIARQELVAEQRAVAEAVRSLEQGASLIPIAQGELENVRARLRELEIVSERRDQALHLLQSNRTESELLKQANERVKAEGESLAEKIALLEGKGAACPLCGTELGEEGRQDLENRLHNERSSLRTIYTNNQQSIKDLERRIRSTQELLADYDRALQEMPLFQKREGELAYSIDAGRQALDALAQQKERAISLEKLLATCEYAHSDRLRLAVVENEAATLGYDPIAHEEARRQVQALDKYEELHNRLSIAAQMLENEQLSLHRVETDAENRKAEIQEVVERITNLQAKLLLRPQVDKDLAVVESQRLQKHQEWTAAVGEQGRLSQLIDRCNQAAGEKEDLVGRQSRAAVDKLTYDELAQAYGRNGIQAMLIDGVLPELEEEANNLLDRMTQGHMRVRFHTQRQARSRNQTIETLDIIISDDMGDRPYELYSGGEAFRANFAIRVALSKLLTRRSGAQLQTLIIDEGFGTQDTQGRERLVEAINSISEDFERILVITHIDELKDAFPVRIEVSKGEEGSQFSIVGA